MPELAKAYEPQQVEDRLYQKWQEGGYFKADPKSEKPPYSIVMPPPNVTGKLTLGHVLNNTIQDILCRKARMEGKEVLWLPGTDHAGLATQTAVEKHIRNTEKKTRHDFGREAFVKRIWDWKHEFGGIITQQLRKIGASCDWSRERFTMDPDYERAVQEVFVKLYNEGLIYRGTRMVNWCPGSLTAISDEEVIPTKQKGFLYYVKYELVSEVAVAGSATVPSDGSRRSPSDGTVAEPATATFLVVATTRPETIMADVALAVKPGGKWAHLVGRKVWRPLHREQIPIIADEAVEEGFGTGVLKVTPAHDKTDWEIYLRIPVDENGERPGFRSILTPNGKIEVPGEHDASELHGMDRFEARKRSAELLKERGLLVKEEPYENTVGFSERANVPIEPRLSTQWFLKYPNIKEALALLGDGHVHFHPAHWTKVYEHWLENIQDWCISRQVWWGHRIPVWYDTKQGDLETLRRPTTKKMWDATVRCQLNSPGEGWEQDADVLDTWFSSWLWAYETMRTEDGTRQKFYPTSALVTGPDIIFLWVARMLIAGLHFKPNSEVAAAVPSGSQSPEQKTPPLGTAAATSETLEANLAFKDVYFTGLIRDRQGRKLSKSLGNSPDPLDLIAKYGADGLRFGLVRIAPQGADIRFDEKQIEEGRNFCNKLWNICRFRAMQGPIDPEADPSNHDRTIFADMLLADLEFILNGNSYLRTPSISGRLNDYEFSEAINLLYDFVWNCFASQFVEAAKVDFQNPNSTTRPGTLATFDYVMSRVLRLLHPFAPFITEELWCELGFGNDSISKSNWPTNIDFKYRVGNRVNQARAIFTTADQGRALRSNVKVPSNQRVPFTLQFTNDPIWEGNPLPDHEREVLKALLNASDLEITYESGPPPSLPLSTALPLTTVVPARVLAPISDDPMTFTTMGLLYIHITGLVDPVVEKDRLTKELAKVEKDLEQTRRKLGDANMLAKAPPAKVEEWRALEISLTEKEKSLRESLKKLG